MKQPGSGRERLVGDTVHDGTPQVTAPADATAKDNHKDGRALRVETVINAPGDLGCQRRLRNLDELQARARAVNARLLQTERAGQACVLANPVFERIAHPSVDAGRGGELQPCDLATLGQALAGALASTLCAVTGITNKSLRALMTGPLGAPNSMNQASYDLARLTRNALITGIPHRNLYALTPRPALRDLRHQSARPPPAPSHGGDQPQAPPPLCAALRVIDGEATPRLAAARLPAA